MRYFKPRALHGFRFFIGLELTYTIAMPSRETFELIGLALFTIAFVGVVHKYFMGIDPEAAEEAEKEPTASNAGVISTKKNPNILRHWDSTQYYFCTYLRICLVYYERCEQRP